MWTLRLEGRLKRIFGPKRKVMRGWRKLSVEYDNLYTPTSIMVIISLKVRWEGNVAHMEDAREMRTSF